MNGVEAVQRVVNKGRSPCCKAYKMILMDLNMPVMDGIEAAATILRCASEGKVPTTQVVVALTGDELSQPEEDRLRVEAGFVAFYVKPISRTLFGSILQHFDVPMSQEK